jgi:glutamate dehydrogenase
VTRRSGTRQHGVSEQRDVLLTAIASAAGTNALPGIPSGPIIREYYRDLDIDDLKDSDPQHLANEALAHLEFALTRRRGRPKVRIYNADETRGSDDTRYTIVEIVTDDMPFLVDSVSLAIDNAGADIALTVHPVFVTRRNHQGHLTKLNIQTNGDQPGTGESFARFKIQRLTQKSDRDTLAAQIRETLGDIRAAVRDWQKMTSKMSAVVKKMREHTQSHSADKSAESIALLDWLAANNFTFLGYRYDELKPAVRPVRLVPQPGTSLGILSRPRSQGKPRPLTASMKKFANSTDLLVITKTASRSTIHRPGHMDYIAVKDFNKAGRAVGEHRFMGLFTSTFYSESPHKIPLLRHKISQVFKQSGFTPNSHRGKALTHTLEQYPRDELFQSSVSELVRVTQGILSLQERRKVRLFIRRDIFRQFISCLVYVPRDRYHTQIRERIENILLETFNGEEIDTVATVSESMLARLYLVVQVRPDERKTPDVAAAEKQIADAVVNWHDRLQAALLNEYGVQRGDNLLRRYGQAFPVAYREDIDAVEASSDISFIDRIVSGDSNLQFRLCESLRGDDNCLRFKLIRADDLLPLSRVLPILENFGLSVISERPYELAEVDSTIISLQDVEILPPDVEIPDFRNLAHRFKEAFRAVLEGDAEDDSLNRLIWLTSLDWKEVVILRTYCRYLVQTGSPFSAAYMADVLCDHPEIAGLFVQFFKSRLSPHYSQKKRATETKRMTQELTAALEQVNSLDIDRILRIFEAAFQATLRTNYFHVLLGTPVESRPSGYLSIKLDPSRIPGLPEPRPMFEIFVYAPYMEGIHLRSGYIARGGLRWSDRKEDFRTEVLGLMKAQVVKNAVIIPTGAKGGFVIKPQRIPDRDQWAVIDVYRTFIRGLLDITDNIIDNKIIPPPNVVRIDKDDAYLVVAADKGTATFSDTANAVAAEYDFWLQDAFASGGSSGYDHKKMGITARGAWEAVKRHFRELGTDIQTTPFTVAGIGDMAGDVFGNGMLLSKHIRLLAAFNHRHIFLDPDPDTAASYKERQRLFRKSGSCWTDYDTRLLSSGGGVFDRQSKRIDLNSAVRTMLDTQQQSVNPPELIRLILCMQVDLLWNGGIGTYVKSSRESQGDAGDRSNDAVRVNGNELRCKVIGEGGNLGLTQQARIEFSQNGGLVNTDSVDNSAGVDCSDREVNIKILLSLAQHERNLPPKRRNKLLVEMTDEVAAQVLRDNYLQTQGISMAATYAADRLMEYAELIRILEQATRLDRELEALPDDEVIAQRAKTSAGLTRPELATVISHAKIYLTEQIIESDLPEDKYFSTYLVNYFPPHIRKPYGRFTNQHPLRREIIATLLSNSIIDRMGPTFVLRAQDATGEDAGTIARAFAVVRQVFAMDELWSDIEALDNQVPASAQSALLFQSARMLRQAAYWVMRHADGELQVAEQIAMLKPSVDKLYGLLNTLLKGSIRRRKQAAIRSYEELGVPTALARRMAGLDAAIAVLDVVAISRESGRELEFVAKVHLAIGRGLNLAWLRSEIESLSVTGRWQSVARRKIRDDLSQVHRDITTARLAESKSASADELVVIWLTDHGARIQRTKGILLDIKSQQTADFATLTVAIGELRQLAG